MTGAKNMDDLMAIPEEELIKYYTEPYDEEENTLNDINNMPLRDGKLIPEDPLQALADGAGKDVILMTGSNANEWNYWIHEMEEEDIKTATQMYEENIVEAKFGQIKELATKEDNQRITEFLNLQTDKEELWAKTELLNDLAFRVPAIVEAANHSDAGGISYMYYFGKETDDPVMKACHASELSYVFYNSNGTMFDSVYDEALGNKICNAWASFARNGNPSTDKVEWKEYNSKTRDTMMVDSKGNMQMESNPLKEQRELVEPLLKYGIK